MLSKVRAFAFFLGLLCAPVLGGQPQGPVRLIGGLEKHKCAEQLLERGQRYGGIWATSGLTGMRALPVARLLDDNNRWGIGEAFRFAVNTFANMPSHPNAEAARLARIYFPTRFGVQLPKRRFDPSANLIIWILEGSRVQTLDNNAAGGILFEHPKNIQIKDENFSFPGGKYFPIVFEGKLFSHAFLKDRNVNDEKHATVRALEFYQYLAADNAQHIFFSWIQAADFLRTNKADFSDPMFSSSLVIQEKAEDGTIYFSPEALFFFHYAAMWLVGVEISDFCTRRDAHQKLQSYRDHHNAALVATKKTVNVDALLEQGIPGVCPGPIRDMFACYRNMRAHMLETIRIANDQIASEN